MAVAAPDFSTTEGIWKFILGEIPFLCLMVAFIYFSFIRPRRKEKRESADPNRKTQMGDEILFKDGMVGILVNYKDGIVTVESGSLRSKYQIKDDMFSKNISAEERIKKAYNKLTFAQKVLSKI